MSGAAVTISDSVTAAINAGSYSNSYAPTAHRRLSPNRKVNREDITSLNVLVSPLGLRATIASLDSFSEDYRIGVFVYDNVEKAADSDNYNETTISNLLTFCDEMQKQVISYADDQANGITFLGEFSSDPLYDESYMTAGIFNSITEFTFRNQKGV